MLFNHYEAQLLMRQRMADRLREVEQARLVRVVQASEKSERWQSVTLALTSLLAVFARPADEPRSRVSATASNPVCECPTPSS
jgi:hypothetical protein